MIMLAQTPFLGENLLPLLVLAFGGALLAGNALALVKPPEQRRSEDDLEQAPVLRTVAFMVAGLLMTVWAVASLLG